MTQSFASFHPNPNPTPACSPGTAIYTHPDDVVRDAHLSTAQKREILASWVSDARAVEDAPALRRLDSGAIVEVDSVLRALASLDEAAPRPTKAMKRPFGWSGVVARWLNRAPPKGANDDDDDPPPAPAGLSAPFRPTFVAAHGARGILAGAGAARRYVRRRNGDGRGPLAAAPRQGRLAARSAL